MKSSFLSFSLALSSVVVFAEPSSETKTDPSLFDQISEILAGKVAGFRTSTYSSYLDGNERSWQLISNASAHVLNSQRHSAVVVDVYTFVGKMDTYTILNATTTKPTDLGKVDNLSIEKISNIAPCDPTVADAFELTPTHMVYGPDTIANYRYIPKIDSWTAQYENISLIMIPYSTRKVPLGVDLTLAKEGEGGTEIKVGGVPTLVKDVTIYRRNQETKFQMWVAIKRGKGGPMCAAVNVDAVKEVDLQNDTASK